MHPELSGYQMQHHGLGANNVTPFHTHFTSPTMGASPSKQSYLQYTNDFELVIRCTKDLEHLLETEFGAPSSKQTGLHDKISHAQNSAGLTHETVKKMRYLVTCECELSCLTPRPSQLVFSLTMALMSLTPVRNKMVHEYNFNTLPDRQGFATSYDQVEKELRTHLAGKKGKEGQVCTIS